MQVDDELLEFRYSWWARHASVKRFLAAAILALIVGLIFSAMEKRPVSMARYDALLWLLVGAFVLGYVNDACFGVIRKGSKVIVTTRGVEIYDGRQAVTRVSWDDIVKVDDFDYRERVNEKNNDFWKAGVGGVRITDKRGNVYKVYQSIDQYGELRSMIAKGAINAVVMHNGQPVVVV
jgi:hypothetical protein